MNLIFNFWLLPILFMLHDFEEIIFVPSWVEKHAAFLKNMKNPLFGAAKNSSLFSIAVLEEFVILILVTIICFIENNYLLYLSFLIAYTLHFLIHFGTSFYFKFYSPGVITALLELPLLIWLILKYYKMCNPSLAGLLIYLIPTLIFVTLNLFITHKLITWFYRRTLFKNGN
ncbi:HXXEE domain-containing protein [Fructilactobacillus frigidiflavus]|uniref:HXXEE domain-containing protein n=1 Tax=Fructilactobacillus frigidiflavus TaxID=3242688 RepID=UPI003757BE3F